MNLEIERRFLFAPKKTELLQFDNVFAIEQGYLSNNKYGNTIRVRTVTETLNNNFPTAFITIKNDRQNFSCNEYEYEIPFSDGKSLFKSCPFRLSKTRRTITIDSRKWELDYFNNELEGLFIAEIELNSADEIINLPDFITKEITNEKDYSNYSLARKIYDLNMQKILR